MHGLRDLNGTMDSPERAAQARRLREISCQVSGPEDVILVCGDFNVEPTSETHSILADTGRGFERLMQQDGHQTDCGDNIISGPYFSRYSLTPGNWLACFTQLAI